MKDLSELCPICGEGSLHAEVGENPIQYKEQSATLELHFSVCAECGSEQADAAQLRVNKRAMIAFKKQVDGLLSGGEVRALRERLKLNQAEAARIFGGGPVAFSKYETDDVAQSEAMDKLLRLAMVLPGAVDYLRYNAGLKTYAAAQWIKEKVEVSPAGHHRLHIISTSTPKSEQTWRNCA